MKILIVEDDENKLDQLYKQITSLYPKSAVVDAKSMNSGLRSVMDSSLDLVLLDMTMSTFDVQAEIGSCFIRHDDEYI